VANYSLQGQLEVSINWSVDVHIVILDEVRQADLNWDINVCVESDSLSIGRK
jgi:hypothetical protein